jgi:hypothetical protein
LRTSSARSGADVLCPSRQLPGRAPGRTAPGSPTSRNAPGDAPSELFFLRGSDKKEKGTTVESVKDTIASIERQIVAQKEILADLEADVVDEEKKAAKVKAKRALAEQLEKEAVEAELQAKAKRAKIAELGI